MVVCINIMGESDIIRGEQEVGRKCRRERREKGKVGREGSNEAARVGEKEQEIGEGARGRDCNGHELLLLLGQLPQLLVTSRPDFPLELAGFFPLEKSSPTRQNSSHLG